MEVWQGSFRWTCSRVTRSIIIIRHIFAVRHAPSRHGGWKKLSHPSCKFGKGQFQFAKDSVANALAYIYLYLWLYTHPMCINIYIYIFSYIYIYTIYMLLYLSTYLSICVSVCLSIHLSIYLSIYLCIYIYIIHVSASFVRVICFPVEIQTSGVVLRVPKVIETLDLTYLQAPGRWIGVGPAGSDV